MKRLVLVFCLISILLFSCSRSSFSISNMRLEAGEEGYFISALLEDGDEEENYSFILKSPDGDLVWKGNLILDKGRLTSEALLLTPGVSMEKGEYSLIVHSTNGTDIKNTVIL